MYFATYTRLPSSTLQNAPRMRRQHAAACDSTRRADAPTTIPPRHYRHAVLLLTARLPLPLQTTHYAHTMRSFLLIPYTCFYAMYVPNANAAPFLCAFTLRAQAPHRLCFRGFAPLYTYLPSTYTFIAFAALPSTHTHCTVYTRTFYTHLAFRVSARICACRLADPFTLLFPPLRTTLLHGAGATAASNKRYTYFMRPHVAWAGVALSLARPSLLAASAVGAANSACLRTHIRRAHHNTLRAIKQSAYLFQATA